MARQEILSSEYLLASLPKINENFSELYNSIGGTSGVAWADILDKPLTFPSTWAEVSGKPASYPSTWESVSNKPTAFAPSAHKVSHATGAADAIAPADIGAAPSHNHPYAPSSHVGSRDGHPLATTTADGLQAAADKAKLEHILSPTDFGAIPNDPASAAANRAAFQSALDTGGRVAVPAEVFYIDGGLTIPDFAVLAGAGLYGDSGTTGRTGATKLIFTGSGTACLSASDATTTLLHAGLSDMAIHVSGSYSWILDLPTLAGWKMANLRMEPTSTSCGGIRARKINASDSSWVVNAYDVQIRLPDASTAYNMDVDCSDGAFVGGSLTGGAGAILRGTGGFKFLGTRIDRSNQWGLTISVETEARSQHIVNGCQIEENDSGGILVNGDANNALSQTWVGFVIADNAFRNPHPGAADIELRNNQAPALRGGVIGPNAHNTTATPILYNPGGWTDVTILPGGVHQGSGAPNFYAGGKFLQSPLVLAQSAVPVSHTGTTTETVLATITIPAKAMDKNGRLRITTIWSATSSTNAKTLLIRHGGAATMNIGIAANNAGFRSYTEIANRNSFASQVVAHPAHAAFGQGAFAPIARAVDTAVDQNLTISAILGDASEAVTLESYLVEVLPGQ